MIVNLLLEGFESALLPCSFVLLVPGAAAALASRQESTSAFVGFFIGVSAVAFWRFSGRIGDISNLAIALARVGEKAAVGRDGNRRNPVATIHELAEFADELAVFESPDLHVLVAA